jgi:glutamate racemase
MSIHSGVIAIVMPAAAKCKLTSGIIGARGIVAILVIHRTEVARMRTPELSDTEKARVHWNAMRIEEGSNHETSNLISSCNQRGRTNTVVGCTHEPLVRQLIRRMI